MPADAKEILDDAVDRREALEVRDRFEAAHLALAVAGRLMRHFDAIVRIRGCAVHDRRDQGTAGGLIARQLVGDQAARDGALCFQELAEESDRSSPIPSGLHEDVDHIPILVNRPPQVLRPALHPHEQLIEIPRISLAPPPPPQPSRILQPERQAAGWPGEVTLPGLPQIRTCPILVLVVVLAMVGGNDHGAAQTLWRGLVVAPEVRCAPYDADAYRYPQSVEAQIIAALGGVYGPYTGRWFASPRDTDIEHIVARSEAHDSGLCAADAASQRRFASDLLNLTLASPAVNRTHKNDKDAAEWLPDLNQCWFADRVVAVRRKFDLTIDPREAAALDRVLVGCRSTAMLVVPRPAASTQRPTPPPALSPPVSEALARWDDNGNGRITCAEARRHGIAPVRRGHPAYPYMRDADNDGIVCE